MCVLDLENSATQTADTLLAPLFQQTLRFVFAVIWQTAWVCLP